MANNTGIIFDFSKKVNTSDLPIEEINRLATLSNYNDTEVRGLIIAEASNRSSAISTAVSAEAAARSDKDTELEGRIGTNEGAIEILNGDVNTEGSVAKQIADAVAEEAATARAAERANAGDIETLKGDVSTEGSVAKTVKDAVDAEATARSNADADLQTAIDTINSQLGGSGEGGVSLSSRVEDLETATVVEATKNAPLLDTTYVQTSDEEPVEGKIYFTRTGEEGAYTYVKVDSALGEFVENVKYFEVAERQINDDYMPTLKFQGQTVGKLSGEIDIIGIGNVSVDPDTGKIQIRLGENLNCSLWNKTDGISTTTVTSVKSGDTAGIVSGDYAAVSTAGSKRIFYGTDKITANAGTAGTTTAGATKANGNEIHFDDNTSGYFLVNIKEGKNTEATVYRVGPIVGNNSSLTAKLNGVSVAGIVCKVTNWGEEPKKANGATGYSANINFDITPASIFGESKDFQLVSIEQVKIADAGLETEAITSVSTWTNSTTNGTYFYLKENAEATYKPAAPTSASFEFTSVVTKKISGVTYITNASTFKVSASGIANVGYPVADGTYVKVATSSNNWFAAFNETATTVFEEYTTVKDATMEYTSAAKKPLIGKHATPELTVAAHNFLGDSATKASAEGLKLLVCDSDGHVTANYGSFTGTEELAAGALAVYDGRLVYPTAIAVGGYNEDIVTGLTQPDYSADTTARSYTKVFTLDGTKPSCKIILTHAASIQSAINTGTLKVEIRVADGTWKDVKATGLMQATSSFAAGTSTLDIVFDPPSTYPTATSGTAVRITMSSAVAEIKDITLNAVLA